MISVLECSEEYKITFRYDPDAVSLIKNVPGRRWNPDGKFWTIPKDKLGWLIKLSKGTKFEGKISVKSSEHINENANLGTTSKIPDEDLSGVKLYVEDGKELYKHQIDFMKFAVNRQRSRLSGFIVGDDMGAGKTLECMNLALYNRHALKYKRCLIICCINTSKYNWVNDIIKHTNGEHHPYILGTRYTKYGKLKSDISSQDKLDDLKTLHMYGDKNSDILPYFIVTNIESIRMKQGRTYPIADAIINMINAGQLNMIIVDEIHKNASPSSSQGKQLLKIKKNSSRCMWIPVTGTPIVNKPTDVFLPLKLVDGHTYTNYYMWCQNFCMYGGFGGHEIVGYKNIPSLKLLLEDNMIRRLKSEILDLPDKIYYTEYVENTRIQSKLYNQVLNDLIRQRDEIQGSLNPLAKFMKLRQVNGSPELVDDSIKLDKLYIKHNAKLVRLLELISDIMLRGEKVIIFSNWVEPLRTIYRFLAPHYRVVSITGTMSVEAREESKRIFMEDSNCKIIIGTIGAMGTSHTLTAATNVIFYDEPWTPSDKAQAEDRAHRIGTTQSLNVYTIITKDTIDERVHNILYSKDMITKYIVDDKLDIKNNPKLLDFLLGKEDLK